MTMWSHTYQLSVYKAIDYVVQYMATGYIPYHSYWLYYHTIATGYVTIGYSIWLLVTWLQRFTATVYHGVVDMVNMLTMVTWLASQWYTCLLDSLCKF